MTTIGAIEAKSRLSELLDRVARGEEIVITRDGKPAARLVPAGEESIPKKKKAAAAELRAIAERFRANVKVPFSCQDINDILYDKDGLPK
jgi:prevent-host-death family protein